MIIDEGQVNGTVDHLFRHHAGQMVAVLSRIFGFEHLDMAEDAVQDALLSAMKTWPFAGVPDNPRAWMTAAARNRMIDRLRRDMRSRPVDESTASVDDLEDRYVENADGLIDDQVRMIFACCHPAISPDSQVALVLRTVGGFSVAEIARAYLSKSDAVAKLLTRAKAKLRAENVTLAIPPAAELRGRLDAALKAIYLIFNEGYNSSTGSSVIRQDLCFEAIRLCELITLHPVAGLPKVHAAAALFLFQAARLPARENEIGELVVLAEQDRSLWDARSIRQALAHFRLSASGDELTDFHIEAEIAALYSLSKDFGSIDWRRILELYDELQKRGFSAVAEINRIIVIGKLSGAAAALAELERLAAAHDIDGYQLFHITRAHFLAEAGEADAARASYRTSLARTDNLSVQRFLEQRISQLSPGQPPAEGL